MCQAIVTIANASRKLPSKARRAYRTADGALAATTAIGHHRAVSGDGIPGWVLLVDWRDGAFSDAKEAVRDALTARGVDPDAVPPQNIRIDSGSRRAGEPSAPYFRAWVAEIVLTDR